VPERVDYWRLKGDTAARYLTTLQTTHSQIIKKGLDVLNEPLTLTLGKERKEKARFVGTVQRKTDPEKNVYLPGLSLKA
jgi:hypothetical protein